MALTEEQNKDAVKQMIAHCDLKMENYEMVSARSVLYELGFDADQTGEVLRYIADHGFDYCLDSTIMCSNGIAEHHLRELPDQGVCYWGPDQLKSRLQCLR